MLDVVESLPDDEFLRAFEACEVSHTAWTHRCHIRLARLMLQGRRFDEALNMTRSGIQKLNARHQTPEGLERGYHETVTHAWLKIVAATMKHHGHESDSRAFCDKHPQLMSSKLLRLYYTRERIITLEAKREFVEPDIAPLPTL